MNNTKINLKKRKIYQRGILKPFREEKEKDKIK